MTASEAMEQLRRENGSYFLGFKDGSIEFRHSSFPNGPDHESEQGQRFGTSYLWARFVHPDGLKSFWVRTGSRSLARAVMDAIHLESTRGFLDSLDSELAEQPRT